jgi:hypothetical protein
MMLIRKTTMAICFSLVLMVALSNISAGQMSSSSYRIPADVADAAGERGSSPSYMIRDCIGQPSPGGIGHSSGFSIFSGHVYVAFPLCGDCNEDNKIDAGDVVCLLAYLFREGQPPCLPEGIDPNCDGGADASDIVYLINFLFREGPPPCVEQITTFTGKRARPNKERAAAQVRLSSVTISPSDISNISVMGRFDVNLAAVQLEIEYDPENLTLLEPALTKRTEDLAIYSCVDQGIQKIGIIDLSGQHFIPAGSGILVNLKMKGTDLRSLKIAKAVLVDRDAQKIPVRIVSVAKKSEEGFAAQRAVIPQAFSLSQNCPNPFNPQTEIRYALPKACYVKLSIYNLLGQRIRTLVNEYQAAGHKTVHWDGTDEDGREVASGVYFSRIQAREFTDSRKMILMK